MDANAAKHVGAQILGEIKEESLEDLLSHLRSSTQPPSQGHPPLNPKIPIAPLSTLISKYHHAHQSAPPPVMSLSGRYLPFLYHLVSTLISAPHRYTIVVIDADHKFDVTRLIVSPPDTNLPATPEDLSHVYIYRPARPSLYSRTDDPAWNRPHMSIDASEQHMLYGAHASRHRVWWGTIVIGGSGGDVNAGWRGWMDVQRQEVAAFGLGISAEEGLAQRDIRYERVQERGWEGRSRVGIYSWGERNA